MHIIQNVIGKCNIDLVNGADNAMSLVFFAILFAERVEWLNIILAHLHLTLTHSPFLTHINAHALFISVFFLKNYFQQHTHLSIRCPHKY